MSRTCLAILHFDGSKFAGWQRQPAGRTVQGEVERVLAQLAGERVVAHAAGRTDAGVHARGMGVSVQVPDRWTPDSLHRALNGLLPADCWVERVHEMVPGFHARKSAEARRYHYLVGTDDASRSPFRRPFEWAVGRALDQGVLDRAASVLVGPHQFQAFAARGQLKPHYRCTVGLARWVPRGDQGLTFEIEADRFLHHMVRFLVGTMVDIGLNRRPLEDMERLLARPENDDTSPPAPPQGLYFIAARYPATAFLSPPGAMA